MRRAGVARGRQGHRSTSPCSAALKDEQALEGLSGGPLPAVRSRPQAHRGDGSEARTAKQFKVTKGAPQVILELSANAAASESRRRQGGQRVRRARLPLAGRRADRCRRRQWQFLGCAAAVRSAARGVARRPSRPRAKMGVQVKMVTGDQLAIGKEIAAQLGLGTNILDASRPRRPKHQRDRRSRPRPSRRPTASRRSSPSTSITSSRCCRSTATSSA